MTSHVVLLPLSEQLGEEVALELAVEYLREEVKVAHEGRLQNDWDVRGVEELDRVRLLIASDLPVVQHDLNSEALKVHINKTEGNFRTC